MVFSNTLDRKLILRVPKCNDWTLKLALGPQAQGRVQPAA
jgi:hypothetical protein